MIGLAAVLPGKRAATVGSTQKPTIGTGVWGAGVTNTVAFAADSVHGGARGGRDGLVLAGTDIGGVMLSGDRGLTWVPSFYGITQDNQSVASIVWSNLTPGTAYLFASAGLTAGFVFCTTDYAVSWALIATTQGTVAGADTYPRGVGDLICLDETNAALYLGTVAGLYRVDLSSFAVSLLTLGGQTITSVMLDPTDNTGNTLWVSVTQERAFTIDPATNILVLAGGHTYTNGNIARVKSTGTLPAPLAANTDYVIANSDQVGGTVQLSSGGSIVNVTTAGSPVNLIASGAAGLYRVTGVRTSPVASVVYVPPSRTIYDIAVYAKAGAVQILGAAGSSGAFRYDPAATPGTLLRNTFDAGVSGAAIKTSDTGSGSPWDLVSANTAGGAAVVYDTTAPAAGAAAASLTSPTTAGTAFLQWAASVGLQTNVYTRFFVRLPVLPFANLILLRTRTPVAGNAVNVRLNATNHFELTDSASAVGGVASVAAMPVNTWVRVEAHIVYGTGTAGSIACRLYNLNGTDGPNTTTIAETVTRTGIDTSAGASEFSWGILTGFAAFVAKLDNIALSLTDWIGPVVSPGAATDITGALTTNPTAITAARITGDTATRILVGQAGTGSSTAPKLAWTDTGDANPPTWTAVAAGNSSSRVGGASGPVHWLLNDSPTYLITGNTADVNQVEIDPNNVERWLAAERTSPYRRDAGDTVWYPTTQGVNATVGLTCRVHPSTPGKVVFGDVDWTVLRSTDGMVTQPWSPILRPAVGNGFSLAFHPITAQVILGIGQRDSNTGGEVYLATDAFPANPATNPWTGQGLGAVWGNRVTGVGIGDDGAGNTILLGFSEAKGLYRKAGTGAWTLVLDTSADTGTSTKHDVAIAWPLAATGVVGPNVYMLVPNGNTNGGLWRSTNRGLTWARLAAFSVASRSAGRLVAHPTQDTLYFVRDGAGVGVWKVASASTTATITKLSLPSISAPGPLAIHPGTGALFIAQTAPITKLFLVVSENVVSDLTDAVWRGACGFVNGMDVDPAGALFAACRTGGYVARRAT